MCIGGLSASEIEWRPQILDRDGGVSLSTNSHNWVAGLSILSIWQLDRLSKTSFWRDPYCIYAHMYFCLPALTGLIIQAGEQGEASAVVGGSALFSVCVDTCALLCAYARTCCVHVYMCAYWALRLVTGCTGEHGAAAASTLLGYQTWQLLKFPTLELLVLAINSPQCYGLKGSLVQQQQR